MDQAATIAIGTVFLGAILGGVIRVVTAWVERNREGRAAALVVWDTLQEALIKTHEPRWHLYRPVVVAFDAYVGVWEVERKALARTLPSSDFAAISKAFAELHTLRRSEEAGHDLREEVFDSLYEAGQLCEMARRVAWRHAQSPRARALKWLERLQEKIKKRREYRRMGRNLAKLRKQSRTPKST